MITILGLGFRPISENADERSLVWYSASNSTQVAKWTNRLDIFLESKFMTKFIFIVIEYIFLNNF